MAGDRVTLTIRDDGNGIVLQPIQIQEQRGTGMNLVRAISRQLGGDFAVDRVPAGGTCATISFRTNISS
jgi:two-component sensor histidine kinase